MDLSLIKAKLAASQSKSQKKEKIDYTKIFWKPTVGSHKIRILPSKFDKQNPFREVYLHYGFSKGPILALTNWGEKDPIAECAKALRKSADKEDWQLAKKVEPKLRYFAPVLVRGEEEKGARLWEFGKLIYEQLLGISLDEDYGDYTGITDGRDFTVDAVEDMVAGRKGIKCTLRVKPKTTPISNDAEFVTKLLEDQPDILGINKRYTFDELKDVLDKFLNPDNEEHTDSPIVTKDEDEDDDIRKEVDEAPAEHYKLDTKQTKSSNVDKFEDLFAEPSDLPF